MFHIHCKD